MKCKEKEEKKHSEEGTNNLDLFDCADHVSHGKFTRMRYVFIEYYKERILCVIQATIDKFLSPRVQVLQNMAMSSYFCT